MLSLLLITPRKLTSEPGHLHSCLLIITKLFLSVMLTSRFQSPNLGISLTFFFVDQCLAFALAESNEARRLRARQVTSWATAISTDVGSMVKGNVIAVSGAMSPARGNPRAPRTATSRSIVDLDPCTHLRSSWLAGWSCCGYSHRGWQRGLSRLIAHMRKGVRPRIRVMANADDGRYYTRLARVGEQESKRGRPD